MWVVGGGGERAACGAKRRGGEWLSCDGESCCVAKPDVVREGCSLCMRPRLSEPLWKGNTSAKDQHLLRAACAGAPFRPSVVTPPHIHTIPPLPLTSTTTTTHTCPPPTNPTPPHPTPTTHTPSPAPCARPRTRLWRMRGPWCRAPLRSWSPPSSEWRPPWWRCISGCRPAGFCSLCMSFGRK